MGLPTTPAQRYTKTLSNNDLRLAHCYPHHQGNQHPNNNRSSHLHYDLGRIPGGSKTKSCSTLDIRSQLARDNVHVYSNVNMDEERDLHRRNLELKARAYMARGRSIGELRSEAAPTDVWRNTGGVVQGGVVHGGVATQSRGGRRRSRLIENDTLY